uniref:SFRICE_023750 n=1 Tax=Spodoptera frugiperda TaxID=7108 RepID=A0A2H1VBT5_SPOFR
MIGGSPTQPQQRSIAHLWWKSTLKLKSSIIVHKPASYASHATDFMWSCIETHTTASTDPHRTNRIISNAYMRCVLMTFVKEHCCMVSVKRTVPNISLDDSGKNGGCQKYFILSYL